MSALFAAATANYLINSAAPVTATPFTVGMWVNMLDDTISQTFWGLEDTGGTANYWSLSFTPADNVYTYCAAGTVDFYSAASLPLAGEWFYLLFRAVSATNRRTSLLNAQQGTLVHSQSTAAKTPAGVDAVTLGAFKTTTASDFSSALIAEYFMTDTDIQPDGTASTDSLVRQLAYSGPFSVAQVGQNVVDYRSLFSNLGSSTDNASNVARGGKGPQTWTNTNAVVLGAHPPLVYNYARPAQMKRKLVV